MTVVGPRRGGARGLLAISEDGDVFTNLGGEIGHETIEPRPRALRGVCTIDGVAVAHGMRRQVFIRDQPGRWRAMHAPDLVKGESGGFEGLCGFSSKDLDAVGWEGEIWHHDGARWRQKKSPVDVILTDATTHSDGKVYACGQNGALVRGRADRWEIVAADQTLEDFWAIESFDGRIIAASFGGLHVLDGDRLELVDLGEVDCGSFAQLAQADGVLWSSGSTDIIKYERGRWSRVW